MTSGKATSIDEGRDDPRVRALLERETTLVLATTANDGSPIATPLFYYPDAELNLYWLSSAESRHSRNLLARPRVAVAVFAPVTDWKEVRGVQMEGMASAASDDAILAEYRRRFGLGAELDAVIARSTMYVFRPSWWRFIDSLV
jgi:uncharacterized protein YhbP (UPF0306 family)